MILIDRGLDFRTETNNEWLDRQDMCSCQGTASGPRGRERAGARSRNLGLNAGHGIQVSPGRVTNSPSC